ncbi:CFC_HP_G0030030.mRNA.1.CDS.1 [Saccharomyces cerevisiae]|nr:CFC_HP_G0094700.mRNA.1.CDS.1 [Saccharomyces cerevisiae]CAI5033628.1 CFC_HP_G0030030.mRNA.1.CDS.1 [Saccharomyces cerevisiae]CAI6865049.1 CFC_HP_G0094700.mRNA.1.CDS.1 [Saccharomyces cerevisiae]CAI6950140.1 CFC_HP_G0030030.mRNA.1.CDS.1 [Saccharomyces cerevisiae]
MNSILDRNVRSSETTLIKPESEFDNWLSDENDGASHINVNKDSSSVLSASSFTWFEPLENIISSASSSSIGSPIEDQFISSNNEESALFPTDQFFSNPSSYSHSPEVSSSIKREEDDNALSLADFEPASLQLMPNMINTDNNDDSTPLKNEIELNDSFIKTNLDAKETKKRAPRKRLTPFQKQAHNKIEKRYRININTKIARLQQIIPWVASEQTAFEVGDSVKKQDEDGAETAATTPLPSAAATSTKLNKSMILEKAVDYILYLQNNERLYEMEVQRLKSEIDTLKQDQK